jgi:rRNA maturation protein Nop10
MKEECGCGKKTRIAGPIKFTPNDRVGEYRRKSKIAEYQKKGLL